jgi:hypothetical protein
MHPQLCAIDNGFGDTKFKTEDLMSKFKSRVQIATEDLNSSIIEYEGIRYKIGSGQDDIGLQKTRKEIHRLCTIAALSQSMNEDTKEFRVVVGQPLMQYKNKEAREEFRKYVAMPETTINTKLNNKPKKIIIRDSIVFAQGAAALYSDTNKLQEYKKGLIAVVDWGSITINGFICEGLNPIPDTMFTENLGITILFDRIKTAINSRLSLNVQDYEIPYLLNSTLREMEVIIREVEDEHFEDIIKVMRKKNWSVETISMLGVGGGFLVVKDIYRKFFGSLEISQNPVYANVIGMFNVGRMIWK